MVQGLLHGSHHRDRSRLAQGLTIGMIPNSVLHKLTLNGKC